MAKSVLLGCIIFVVPKRFFVRRAFKKVGALYANDIVQNFYLAQIQQYLLTLCLFALVFKLLQPINAAIVMLSYVLAFMSYQLIVFYWQSKKEFKI